MRIFSYKKAYFTAVLIILLISFSALIFFAVDSKNRKLQREISEKSIKIDELYTVITEYGSDINELRRKLLLPEKNYFNESGNKNSDSGKKAGDAEPNEDLPFYLAADRLIAFNINLENIRRLTEYVSDENFRVFLGKFGLDISKYGKKGYRLQNNGNTYFVIEIYQDDPVRYRIATGDYTKEKFLPDDNNGFKKESEEFISLNFEPVDSFFANIEKDKTHFLSLKEDPAITEFLRKYDLEYTVRNNNETVESTVSTSDGRVIADFSFNRKTGKFTMGSSEYGTFDSFYSSLIDTLNKADKRTLEEITIAAAKDRIIKIAEDPVFKKYLKNKKLVLSSKEREDNDYYYFDFVDSEGMRQGALGVQKHIGEIYLFDREDIVISSLKTISIGSAGTDRQNNEFVIPENIGEVSYQYSGTLTLLLIGSHEKNADTIILANFNEDENRIRLISIPRDLYYKNRKINDYYRTGGGEVFSRIVSEITGVAIDGYIGVDMYAFIDIINILGGIEVELKQDLTDPTYKIRDNGIWTTLHYSRGVHHFNGIEALRIARSRHTSSDFGRSDRQQLILKGVKDKLNDLNLTDVNKLYSIFRTISEYLDTDMSSVELISIFLKYRDADIEKKDGLSVFNVLYNTYSNIYLLKDKSRQYDEGFNRGAWILLPRNNDWNVIKWYINKLINE